MYRLEARRSPLRQRGDDVPQTLTPDPRISKGIAVSTNVLVIGGGAREHALVWKLAASNRIGQLFAAPGNAGTISLAEHLALGANDATGILGEIEARGIDLVVVGPEEPLARGLADRLTGAGVPVFGPTSEGARIESSKAWAKELMRERDVPTAMALTCDTLDDALTAVYDTPLPVVIKADGLAAGKGVVIAESRVEAEQAVRSMMGDGSFGDAGSRVLIEEYLTGMEVSFLAITDGRTVMPLVPACDYKRAHDGDRGPNTGGMGAYTPPAVMTSEWNDWTMRHVITPVVEGMAARGITYRGVLYAGLMLTDHGPKVLEFNCRFGDPETQVILPMLDADLVEICQATATGHLSSLDAPGWFPGACVGVVVASGGYPGTYGAGHPIHGLNDVPDGGIVFHAGTTMRGSEVVTAGGRVLTCVGRGEDMASARALAYEAARAVQFDGAFFRADIAERELR